MPRTTLLESGQLAFQPTERNVEHIPMLENRVLRVDTQSGDFAIWKIAPGVTAPEHEGHRSGFRGSLVAWIGGDLIFTWNLSKAAIFRASEKGGQWSFSRDYKLRSSLPFAADWMIYVGRRRLLAGSDGRVALISIPGGFRQLEPHVRSVEAIAGQRAVVWAGGERVLAHAGKSPPFVAAVIGGRLRRWSLPRPYRPQPAPALPSRRIPVPVYLGANRLALLLDDGRYEVHKVLPNSRMDLEVEDYLEKQMHVQDSIIWRREGESVRYADWDRKSETRRFYSALRRFREQIDDGGGAELSFEDEIDPETGETREGPAQIAGIIGARDASEIYLAHLAQSLNVELNQASPWRLHDYGHADRRRLLNSAAMMEPASDQYSTGYKFLKDGSGFGTPTDPTACWNFLNGWTANADNRVILASTRRETIRNLLRWIMDRLHHGWVTGGDWGRAAYGYTGAAPIPAMLERLGHPQGPPDYYEPTVPPNAPEHYWSWFGCHSAGGLLVWTLRTANIPSESPYTDIEDNYDGGQHNGFDCPVEKLFLAHTDTLYVLKNDVGPEVDPLALCDSGDEYAAGRQRWTTEVTPGEERALAHRQSVIRKTVLAPTPYWVNKKIMGVANNEIVNGSGFGQAEGQALWSQARPLLEAAEDQYRQDNNMVDTDRLFVSQAYWGEFMDWWNNR